MRSITLSEFDKRCAALLNEVQRTGTPLSVTLDGRPLATVTPVTERSKTKRLGALRDWITIHPDLDLVHADTTDDWEMLR